MIGSRLIHFVRTKWNAFLFIAEQYSIVYMCHNFLTHSSADGHLSCFHVLAIVKSAAMNIGVHMFFLSSGFLEYRVGGMKEERGHMYQFSSVQFSSVQSLSCANSLRPHELQHARPPCPSRSPRVHSNSCPSSRWCHPAISSSVVPFSSCPQSLPASESFPMTQLFAWRGQSIGLSASASVLPMNTQD